MPKKENTNKKFDNYEDGFAHDEHTTLKAETLTGDVRDSILDRIRSLRKPWPQASEAEQAEIIEGITRLAEHIVKEVVILVASAGRKAMVGDLEKVTVKDGFQAVISLKKDDPNRHELVDSVSQTVLIVVADVEAFTGEQKKAKPEADQRNLSTVENKRYGE